MKRLGGRGQYDGAELVAALVAPPLLAAILALIAGEGYGTLQALRESANPFGQATAAVISFLVGLYFPDFIVVGSVPPIMAVLGLYLILCIAFAVRRKWRSAVVLLFLPLMVTWWFSHAFLRD